MMDFEYLATKNFEGYITQIKITENIEQFIVDQPMPPWVTNELKKLKNELIENKKIAQQMIQGISKSAELNPNKIRILEEEKRILEEEEDDQQKRVARLELEIFKQGDVIKQLREDVTELQTQLAATQNELVETRNNLTTQLEQTQNEVAELRRIVNKLLD